MTDEMMFARRFVDDVRRCVAGRAPAAVAEVERRIIVALVAPPAQRERRWARVVALVNEMLAGLDDAGSSAAARLRAFARENADLVRPRDVAITDFRFAPRTQGVLTMSSGRKYLVFVPIARAPRPRAPAEAVPGPTRRIAEWTVYALCAGCAVAAFWFAFVVPI
ncbi:MAG: hypothetical protein NVS3B7_17590 [Candidatus Elarobacter sp.]